MITDPFFVKKFLFILIVFCVSSTEIFPRDIDELFFNVYRNDTNIGHHKVIINEIDNTVNVNVEINFKVKFLGFTLYEYFHTNIENWKDNEVYSMQSTTQKNDVSLFCKLSTDSKKLYTNGSNGEKFFSIDSIPSSYWNHKLVEGHMQKEIINTQDCSSISMKIEKLGKEKIYNGELDTIHYKLTGKEATGEDINIDIWYDDMKNWVKLTFIKDGTKIKYYLNEYYNGK